MTPLGPLCCPLGSLPGTFQLRRSARRVQGSWAWCFADMIDTFKRKKNTWKPRPIDKSDTVNISKWCLYVNVDISVLYLSFGECNYLSFGESTAPTVIQTAAHKMDSPLGTPGHPSRLQRWSRPQPHPPFLLALVKARMNNSQLWLVKAIE